MCQVILTHNDLSKNQTEITKYQHLNKQINICVVKRIIIPSQKQDKLEE